MQIIALKNYLPSKQLILKGILMLYFVHFLFGWIIISCIFVHIFNYLSMNTLNLIDPFWPTIYTILLALFISCLGIVAAIIMYHMEKPFIHYHYKKVKLREYLFTTKFCPLWLNRIYVVSSIMSWTACMVFIIGQLIN